MMDTTRISVDARRPIARINGNLYGHFAEHLGTLVYGGIWVGPDSDIPNVRGIRSDVVAALREVHPPVVRWPGGCFADDYHWRDGIGPRERRPVRVNRWWGGEEPNQFGTHEFLDFCVQIGAEPYVCGNVGSGSVREMSDWVEYLNHVGNSELARLRAENGHPEPFGVRLWGVGNENWGCGGNMAPSYYANEFKRYATFLSTRECAPSTGGGGRGQNLFKVACGANGFDYAWTDKFFGVLSGKLGDSTNRLDLVDGYAFHYYCGTAGSATEYTEDEWYLLLLRALAIEEVLVEHRAVMDKYDPSRRVGLVCDEWGTWHKAPGGESTPGLWQQNTIRDALVAALTLDVFNNHAGEIVMANVAQVVNVLQALVLTDGPRLTLTPTYHVYEMYSPHQGALALATSIDTPEVGTFRVPAVRGSCSLEGRSMFLSLVNTQAKEAAEVELSVVGVSGVSPVSWRVLEADDIHAHNTFDDPGRVRPTPSGIDGTNFALPPASVNVFQFVLSE
ncbi:MAG: alpha-N-arabinofuranosidase [Promethearchaeota archaeon]